MLWASADGGTAEPVLCSAPARVAPAGAGSRAGRTHPSGQAGSVGARRSGWPAYASSPRWRGLGVPLTPASPPLSHLRGEGSWEEWVRCSWLCKLLGRRRLPLSPSFASGRGGRGVRGSGLGVAFTTSPQPAARNCPHPGFAAPLPPAGRRELGGVCEV